MRPAYGGPFAVGGPASTRFPVSSSCSRAPKARFQKLMIGRTRRRIPARSRTIETLKQEEVSQGVDLAETPCACPAGTPYACWGTARESLGGDPSYHPIAYARSYAYNLPTA